MAFMVCNVTLGFVGDLWATCNAAIKEKFDALPWRNESPPDVAVDAVRLARLMWRFECGEVAVDDPKVTSDKINAMDKAVQRVAKQLPVACMDDDSFATVLSNIADREITQEAGIRVLPTHFKTSSLCFVDETKLTSAHLKDLRGLFPACPIYKAGLREDSDGAMAPARAAPKAIKSVV